MARPASSPQLVRELLTSAVSAIEEGDLEKAWRRLVRAASRAGDLAHLVSADVWSAGPPPQDMELTKQAIEEAFEAMSRDDWIEVAMAANRAAIHLPMKKA